MQAASWANVVGEPGKYLEEALVRQLHAGLADGARLLSNRWQAIGSNLLRLEQDEA